MTESNLKLMEYPEILGNIEVIFENMGLNWKKGILANDLFDFEEKMSEILKKEQDLLRYARTSSLSFFSGDSIKGVGLFHQLVPNKRYSSLFLFGPFLAENSIVRNLDNYLHSIDLLRLTLDSLDPQLNHLGLKRTLEKLVNIETLKQLNVKENPYNAISRCYNNITNDTNPTAVILQLQPVYERFSGLEL